MYIYICIYVYMYICIYVYVYIYIFMYIYITLAIDSFRSYNSMLGFLDLGYYQRVAFGHQTNQMPVGKW